MEFRAFQKIGKHSGRIRGTGDDIDPSLPSKVAKDHTGEESPIPRSEFTVFVIKASEQGINGVPRLHGRDRLGYEGRQCPGLACRDSVCSRWIHVQSFRVARDLAARRSNGLRYEARAGRVRGQ